MPKFIDTLIGATIGKIDSVIDFPSTKSPPFNIGSQAFADDGKMYVYAKANASIPGATAVCTISPTTFLATASGGAYTSPAGAMVTGDYAWFNKASV